jgi:glutamate N-acetyltransferase/amino-acid N-acetyltransferase
MTATNGTVQAVIVNAGNANCATGAAGVQAAKDTCTRAAEIFNCTAEQVFPSSTGIIGVPLPVEKLLAALPAAAAGLGARPADAEAFAGAIMTTDTKMKIAQGVIDEGGQEIRIFGACKGAGMIGPQLGPPHATMLVYLFTDLAISSEDLRGLLEPAVEKSFNAISVDGDTSTNDTVLLLASGASNVSWNSASTAVRSAFIAELDRICGELAYAIVDDGEGVTHVVTLEIMGTANDADAKIIAKSIAHSPLCKTAWSSADPNWGRLLAAAGYSGVTFDPEDVTVTIGGLPVFERGMRSPAFDEAATHACMKERDYTIAMNFGAGPGHCTFLTCDLTVEYVHINADYST